MSNCEQNKDKQSLSPISLTRQLHDGEISAANLTKESRITCVEYLTSEGYSSAQVAEILKVSTRTIYRDKKCVRDRNAVACSPDFTAKQVGQLMFTANQAVGNLTRLIKEKDCPSNVRVDAIYKTWTIIKELSQMLQSIGYMPNATLNIRADINHHLCEPPSFEQLKSGIELLESAVEQGSVCDEQIVQQIAELRALMQRSSIAGDIKDINNNITEADEND